MKSDRPSAEARIGQWIAGKYRLHGVLGIGGMGAVFEAVHRFTDRHVALKILHPHVAQTKVAVARFLEEARAAATIQHSAVVDVLDAGQDEDGSVYLVFDSLEGETLAKRLKRGIAETPEAATAMAFQLLDVLSAAHKRGIIHRDIKPDNIFFVRTQKREADVKLLDFGIAKRLVGSLHQDLTKVGSVIGTPYYMSPEQMLGEAADARSDLWSVGVVMFISLSLRLPFPGENPFQIYEQVQTKRDRSLRLVTEGVPNDLVAIIDKALSKDICDRFQDALEMRDVLMRTSCWKPPPSDPPRPEKVSSHVSLDPSDEGVRAATADPRKWERALGELEEEIASLKQKAASRPSSPGAKGKQKGK